MISTFVVTYVCFYVVNSCPVLVAPTNGMKDSNDISCDSTVEFSCDACYVLMGNSQLTCLPNQTWSGKEPNCNGQWLVVYLHVELCHNISCSLLCSSNLQLPMSTLTMKILQPLAPKTL